MASPPPPLSATIPLPKKRPSAGANPSSKRRKHSSVGPSHLRQASFPPESSTPGGARSPSVESSSIINGTAPSVISGISGVTGGRKRKKKGGDKDRDGRSVSGSLVNGGTTVGGKETVVGVEEDEEDEEEEEGMEEAEWDGGEGEKEVKEHHRMLLEAFDMDKAERYDLWRRVRLKKDIVRKITNQTLSQSVPQSVVTSVNAYTKIFIGELIERARQVQIEWQVAASLNPQTPHSFSSTPPSTAKYEFQPGHPNEPNPKNGNHALIPRIPLSPISAEAGLSERSQERDRGPLTPDHLREALRRYKKDKEGVVGFGGLSLEGRERTASRVGGKRLFR